MKNNKVILIMLFPFLACKASTAQKTKFKNKEKALTEFINSPEVINNFKNWSHKKDSSVVFVDLRNIINNDTLTQWQGLNLTVLKDGSLVDSLKLFDAHYLLKNRNNYFVLMSREESKNSTIVTLRHASTNIVSTVTITEKNRQYYLSKIENAVW